KVVKSTKGVDMIGNEVDVGLMSDVEVVENGRFINVSYGVDVVGGLVKLHVVEMSLVGMVVEMIDVSVVVGVDINGEEMGAKDESYVIDWFMIEVDKVDGIFKFDANVVRVEEGVGSGQVVKVDI
ncbi:hypothetical protein KI387_033697, partial [Taxus chinensis]